DNDFIDGNQGNDTILMGAGDDTFQWDPGDGSDIVEGEAGNDTMVFNGANIAEGFDVSANGARGRVTRKIRNVVMGLNGVENLTVNAVAGADTLTVNELAGTDLGGVIANLASTVGGSTGDAVADSVIINATSGDDIVTATMPVGDVLVTGLAANVTVRGF